MKNKYYEAYSVFANTVEAFFETFEQYLPAMKTLLNFKFGIIKAI
jgi:hypothetical protein